MCRTGLLDGFLDKEKSFLWKIFMWFSGSWIRKKILHGRLGLLTIGQSKTKLPRDVIHGQLPLTNNCDCWKMIGKGLVLVCALLNSLLVNCKKLLNCAESCWRISLVLAASLLSLLGNLETRNRPPSSIPTS